jgi:hypothetical protein
MLRYWGFLRRTPAVPAWKGGRLIKPSSNDGRMTTAAALRPPMPGSFPIFDAAVERLIELAAPAHALDVGPGQGKFARMLGRAAPACHRAAVEVEASYVERFGLSALYHRVETADIRQWWPAHLDETWDLVLLGDCLEHLPKSDGLDLLNAMVYRSAWIVLIAPEFVVQGAVGGVASENHVSVWSERDLHWHDLFAFDNCRAMTLAVLRGYRGANLSLQQLVDGLHADGVAVHDFDGATPVRPLRLRVVEHPRDVAYRPG